MSGDRNRWSMDPCLEIGDREWLLVMVAGLTRSTPDGVGGYYNTYNTCSVIYDIYYTTL